MKQKLEQLILLLESRSQELENEATSKTNIEGLTTEQARDIKIKKIGESQGINLCVLQIKYLLKDDGYNKAKETLYTEEQVIGFSKWADDFGYMYNSSANCWYTQDGYKRTDEEMIYQYKQSLKQPKKD